MNQDNNKRPGVPEPPRPDGRSLIMLVLFLLAMMFMYFNIRNMTSPRTVESTYTDLTKNLEKDNVKALDFDTGSNEVLFQLKSGEARYRIKVNSELGSGLVQEAAKRQIPSNVTTSTDFLTILLNILPVLFMVVFFVFMFRMITRTMNSKGGIMGLGKNTAKLYEKSTGVSFKDVAAQEEAKESLTEIVDFLHNPQKYADIGARLPKGALLVGPPGTGKTLLAKAVAGEANVPFFSQSGSAFVEMFVGMGAARVRDIFKEAEQKAPCIIFIDEIDAIGKSRENGGLPGGNDEREQTLNQLLAEMDGFDSTKGVVMLAATNRPEVLDKALLRPGRFDRRIIVDAPDLRGREAILRVHSKDVKMGDDVNLKELAQATPGAVGADLANIINEGALRAVKNGRQYVKQEDLMEAIEVVIAGQQKKDRIMSPKEKRIVSFHEIGHALVAALQKNTDPVVKITIIPRTMGSLGYTLQVPMDDKYLMSKEEILTEISILLGGRAAEEVEFGSITTGAANDIERATAMARKMISMYGMSDTFDMMALESATNAYLDGRPVSNVSPETQTKLDLETKEIIKKCHERAVALLRANRDLLTKASEKLLEKETLSGQELVDIIKEFKGEDFIKESHENDPKDKQSGEGIRNLGGEDQLAPPVVDEPKAPQGPEEES
ncbi:Cell division protein FtsH [Clostridiaceae bacterium JG1575]|nr:Cell division protein FtsH [Clostridiaceae bacterium JG1575]